MKINNTTTILICIYLSIAAIIITFLLGPGGVAPRATIFTYIAATLLLLFEFLYLRGKFKWGVLKTIVIELLSLIPQFFVLFIGAFLWFIVLPAILAVIIIRLAKRHKH